MNSSADNRIKKLDMVTVLRIVAFFCIFLLHEKIFTPVNWLDGAKRPWLVYTPAWAGTWIFILLSGYGIAFTLASDKYNFSPEGVIRFYISRLKKIIPVYWFYVFVVSIFITPEILQFSKDNVIKLLNLLLFNYQEEFYSIEFGLAWYMTTLMRLYIVAPFIYYFLNKILNRINIKIVFSIILFGGLLIRVLALFATIIYGEDWSSQVYKPFYYNIDLFACGMLVHAWKKRFFSKRVLCSLRIIIITCLVAVLIFNSYLCYHIDIDNNNFFRYTYIATFPTLYIVLCTIYIYLFDIIKSDFIIRHNWFVLLNRFRDIQFSMYLYHSTVFLVLKKAFDYEKTVSFLETINISPNGYNINTLFTIQGLIVTILWSIVLYITQKKYSDIVFDKSVDIGNYLKAFKLQKLAFTKLNNKLSFILLFGSQLLILSIIIVTGSLIYATNDDTTVASLIGGNIGGQTNFVINLHIILGMLFNKLKVLTPLNIMTIYFIVVIIMSFICIDCLIKNGITKDFRGFLLIASVDTWFIIILGHFTFTVVAFTAAIAALLMLNDTIVYKNKITIIRILCIIILILQAMLIRAECLKVLAVIECIFLFGNLRNNNVNTKKLCIKGIALTCILILLSIVSDKSNYYIEASQSSVQGAFREWGELRSKALDCKAVPFDDDLISEGITANRYLAIYNAFYYDYEIVNSDTMQTLVEMNDITNKYAFDILGFISSYFEYIKDVPRIENLYRWAYLLCLLCGILLLEKNKKNICIYVWGAVCLINIGFYVIQRNPYRVIMPTFMFGFFLILSIIMSRLEESDYYTTIKINKKGSVVLILLISMILTLLSCLYFSSLKKEIRGRDKVLEYLYDNNDKLFLAGDVSAFVIPCTESVWNYPGRDGQWNLIGNWEIYSVPYLNLAEKYNISNPYNTFIESIDNDNLLYLTSVGEEFTSDEWYIVNLLYEKYGINAHFEIVDQIDEYWGCYRLVTD